MINKRKFWWVVVVLVILVLLGVNIYLYWLKNSIYNFIVKEAELGKERMESIQKTRVLKGNPQDTN